ncbi:hypothetical protein AGLY_003261 [Aphis glycines]|uniref:Envelope fusion protein n=1 Tax=Aphis glycines TaxID=307491 RepID=A0A6G0U3J4_APHGL|nr:hypothetical protein AGLY_003261 [Aphis glycines]
MYSTYDEIDQTLCKHASDFIICPEIYPLHPRSIRPICEVQLLQDPKKVPDSCEIMHVQLRTNLFHKLKFKNEWIYASPGETIFITCDNDKRSENHYLEGVGILFLNETCKAYATRDILIPHRVENEEKYIDFIPNSQITEMENIYIDLSTNVLKNKHVRTSQMSDLDLVAKSTVEIKEIVGKKVTVDTIKNSKNRHDYLLYVTDAIVIACILMFVISCLGKLIRDIEEQPVNQNKPIEIKLEAISVQPEELKEEHTTSSEQCIVFTHSDTAYSLYPQL